jgi:Radical SAM superfamily/B12 binding domain
MHLAIVYMGRESVELEYISATLKRAGHRLSFAYDPGAYTAIDNVANIPFLAEKMSRKSALVSRIIADNPDALFFFADSDTYQWSLDIARQVRQGVIAPIIFGGRHPTFAAQAVMKHSFVDNIVVGEAEETLPELLDVIARRRKAKSVRGIYYRDGQKVLETGLRPPLVNLDELPLPDKELFAAEVNITDDYMLLVGRGCPGSCTYCREGTLRRMFGVKYIRRRSVESVLRELEVMKNRYDFSFVMINDPVFFTSKKWTLDLLRGYKERIGLPFRCYGQIKYLDAELVLALKSAGCYGVEFGLQTTNDEMRRDILDRPETLEEAKKAFALCDRWRLRYDVDHIFGLPGETDKDCVDAARLYADCAFLNRVKVHMLVHFPGAPIIDIAEKMGLAGGEDRRRAEEGEVGDICRTGSVNRPDARRRVSKWKNFYKLMPLFPKRFSGFMIDRGANRLLGYIPHYFMIALQLLVAIHGHDWRFWIYIKYHIFRFRRHRRFMKDNG